MQTNCETITVEGCILILWIQWCLTYSSIAGALRLLIAHLCRNRRRRNHSNQHWTLKANFLHPRKFLLTTRQRELPWDTSLVFSYHPRIKANQSAILFILPFSHSEMIHSHSCFCKKTPKEVFLLAFKQPVWCSAVDEVAGMCSELMLTCILCIVVFEELESSLWVKEHGMTQVGKNERWMTFSWKSWGLILSSVPDQRAL